MTAPEYGAYTDVKNLHGGMKSVASSSRLSVCGSRQRGTTGVRLNRPLYLVYVANVLS